MINTLTPSVQIIFPICNDRPPDLPVGRGYYTRGNATCLCHSSSEDRIADRNTGGERRGGGRGREGREEGEGGRERERGGRERERGGRERGGEGGGGGGGEGGEREKHNVLNCCHFKSTNAASVCKIKNPKYM